MSDQEITKERQEMQRLLNEAIIAEKDNVIALYPGYASAHEAFAVLLEEEGEVGDALKRFKKNLDGFWIAARMHDPYQVLMKLTLVQASAIDMAMEAIQCAAVAFRAEESLKDIEERNAEPTQTEIK